MPVCNHSLLSVRKAAEQLNVSPERFQGFVAHLKLRHELSLDGVLYYSNSDVERVVAEIRAETASKP